MTRVEQYMKLGYARADAQRLADRDEQRTRVRGGLLPASSEEFILAARIRGAKNDQHMYYLKKLCKLEETVGRHPGKRANWLKFCVVCGVDISDTAAGVRRCSKCPDTRAGVVTRRLA